MGEEKEEIVPEQGGLPEQGGYFLPHSHRHFRPSGAGIKCAALLSWSVYLIPPFHRYTKQVA